MAGRFSVEAVFKAVDKMTAPVKRIQNRVGKMTRAMNTGFKGVGKVMNKVGRIAKNVGQVIAAAAGATAAAMTKVIGTGAEFEQSIVNAAAKFPGEIRRGTEAFAQLESAARDVGRTTEFTAAQAAEGLNFLAMAGFDAEMSIAALPKVVDLATVAQTDLATATDIATDTLGALGLTSKNTTEMMANLNRVNDVLAKTTTSTNTTLEQMFEAIKDGGPAATAAGADIETVATLIGTMANAGIKGTRAGTALKNIFLAISAPGSEAAQIMKRLGVQTEDANGNVRDAVEVFKEFAEATGKLPNAQQMAVFDAIFGKIPIAAAINITKAADSLTDLRSELYGSQDAASEMASVMRDTVQGRINAFKSAVEGVQLRLFGMNRGPLAETIEKTTEWIRANEELIASGLQSYLMGVVDVATKVWNIFDKVGTIIGETAAKIKLFSDDFFGGFGQRAELSANIGHSGRVGSRGDAEAAPSFLDWAFGAGIVNRPSEPEVISSNNRGRNQSDYNGKVDVTIKDETGRAEVTTNKLGDGVSVHRSGSFNRRNR